MESEALDTGTLDNQRLTDAIRYTCTGGGGQQIYALGQQSTSFTYGKIYQKVSSTNTPAGQFQGVSSGEDTTGTVIPGSLIGYKGNLYYLRHNGTNVFLIKYVCSPAATTVVGGTFFAAYPASGIVPQMFIHQKDKKLYMACGFTAASFDGTTISTRDFSVEHTITSICPYGNNILLGASLISGGGSEVAVWDGSTTASTLVDVVNWGNDNLMILENIGDVVIGVSGVSTTTNNTSTTSDVIIRSYSGGSAQLVQRLQNTSHSKIYPLKAKRNESLYFPMRVYLNGVAIEQIWTIYKNDSGVLVVAPDRKCNNDTEVTANEIIGMSVIEDYMWVTTGSSSSGTMRRTNDNELFTATSSFETLVNDGMDKADKSAKKHLKAISLRCGSPKGAMHTVTVSYKADGGAYRTIYTGVSSAVVRVIEEVGETDGIKFLEGREYMFKVETTGNGEIYEFKYGYEVIKTNI